MVESTEAKQAFAYLRVSTRKQDEEHQRKSIAEYAQSHGFTIDDGAWFTDHAVSGRKVPPLDREGFGEMYEVLRMRKEEGRPVDSVFVYEISRLGRTFWEVIEVVRLLEQEDHAIISASPKEQFLNIDRSLRPFFLSLLTWLAQWEWEQQHERIMSGLESAAAEERHSGNLPLGFSQHVCRKEHGARDRSEYCQLHGKMTLDPLGEQVKNMLSMNPNVRPVLVQQQLGLDSYNMAYKLLRSVKKFAKS